MKEDLLKEDLKDTDSEERSHNFKNTELYKQIKLEILTSSLPKYIWAIEAYNINNKRNDFSLYFDATGMEKSNLFLFYFPYDEIVHKALSILFSSRVKSRQRNDISHQTKFIFDLFTLSQPPQHDIQIGINIIENLNTE